MDWQDWSLAFFMADNERRLAEKRAEAEKREMEEKYIQWCIDHGIPPPPRDEPKAQSYGCGCFSLIILAGLVAWGTVILFLTQP